MDPHDLPGPSLPIHVNRKPPTNLLYKRLTGNTKTYISFPLLLTDFIVSSQ